MKTWQVWMEGYLATGMEGQPSPARQLGVAAAETFADACEIICAGKEFQALNGTFDPVRLSVWGCRLYDNEAAARDFERSLLR